MPVFLFVMHVCPAEVRFTEHSISHDLEFGVFPKAADLDSDGDLDVVCGSSRYGQLRWFENTSGDGRTWAGHVVSETTVAPLKVQPADLDEDGDIDLVSVAPGQKRLVLHENLSGSPPVFVDHVLWGGGSPNWVDVGDLDGDGDLDLVVSALTEDELAWFENHGGQGAVFERHVIPQIPDAFIKETLNMARAVDANGDGRMDVFAVTGTCLRESPPPSEVCLEFGGRVIWYENTGETPLRFEPHWVGTEEDSLPTAIIVENLDGDRHPDIFVGGWEYLNYTWYESTGDASGSFEVRTLVHPRKDLVVPSLVIADLDLDGYQDVVYNDRPQSRMLENIGGDPPQFQDRETVIIEGLLSKGDLDGDGDTDVIAVVREDLYWYENRTIDLPSDLDKDGLPDDEEGWPPTETETHRLLPDSDGDGLGDATEVAGVTNPRARDTDGDGLMDGIEADITRTNPVDPLDPASYTDVDADGLPGPYDPNDADPDTDGDRFSDGYEAAVLGVAACADGDVVPQLADVNLDAAVSNADALAVLHLFIRKIGPEDGVFQGTGFRYADPSRDGHISNMDALLIQSFFLGNVPVLPWP